MIMQGNTVALTADRPVRSKSQNARCTSFHSCALCLWTAVLQEYRFEFESCSNLNWSGSATPRRSARAEHRRSRSRRHVGPIRCSLVDDIAEARGEPASSPIVPAFPPVAWRSSLDHSNRRTLWEADKVVVVRITLALGRPCMMRARAVSQILPAYRLRSRDNQHCYGPNAVRSGRARSDTWPRQL